jgi:hypothetical protein
MKLVIILDNRGYLPVRFNGFAEETPNYSRALRAGAHPRFIFKAASRSSGHSGLEGPY